MGADEIQYTCDRCHQPTRAMVYEHTHDGRSVCLTCWQALQTKDALGRIIPTDTSDAPWAYIFNFADRDLICGCGCHDADLPENEPNSLDGWISDFPGNPVIICKGCVDHNHGRYY